MQDDTESVEGEVGELEEDIEVEIRLRTDSIEEKELPKEDVTSL